MPTVFCKAVRGLPLSASASQQKNQFVFQQATTPIPAVSFQSNGIIHKHITSFLF